MDIKGEILKSIEIMVQKAIEKNQTLDIASVVTDIKNNKYKVIINGSEYWVKDGVGINPSIGMPVWLRVPSGNYSLMYICAKR